MELASIEVKWYELKVYFKQIFQMVCASHFIFNKFLNVFKVFTIMLWFKCAVDHKCN